MRAFKVLLVNWLFICCGAVVKATEFLPSIIVTHAENCDLEVFDAEILSNLISRKQEDIKALHQSSESAPPPPNRFLQETTQQLMEETFPTVYRRMRLERLSGHNGKEPHVRQTVEASATRGLDEATYEVPLSKAAKEDRRDRLMASLEIAFNSEKLLLRLQSVNVGNTHGFFESFSYGAQINTILKESIISIMRHN